MGGDEEVLFYWYHLKPSECALGGGGDEVGSANYDMKGA